MTRDARAETVAFLSQPGAYGGAGPVEHTETHISHVFLVGGRAYKLRKAIKFPYLDYSTLENRKRFTEAEVAINRRTAPDLYLGAAAVVRGADGALALGAPDSTPAGEPVDWVTVMRRFDSDALFDRMVAAGKVDGALARDLADAIAAFHEAAEPDARFGGADAIAQTIDANARDIAAAPDILDSATAATLETRCRAALDRVRGLLDARRDGGLVRHCHGDLHLRNICLVDGRPTLFDAIEFSDSLARIDVLYDLAFLLMDFEHRRRRDLANSVMNRYLARRADYAGLAAMPLFLALRAAIRAHVGAAAAKQHGDAALVREAAAYLDLAVCFLDPRKARLVAIGGLSGSGKTTIAAALAPSLGVAPGAVVLRSDVIRKRIMGVAPETRLGPDGYREDVTERVYATIREEARTALRAGYAAIADAVHARPGERAAIESVAHDSGVKFDGLWLDTRAETLASRIGRRENDASDATADVLRSQTGYALGTISWRRVDVSGDVADTIARARALLDGQADEPV